VRLDESQHLFDLRRRREELDNLALRIDEKFGKVPGNDFGCSGLSIIELTVVPEIDEERMSLFSIDLNLLHHRELNIEILFCEFLNLLRGAIFLTKELVARESEDFEAIVSPSLMGLDHFPVVVRGKSSLASNIDHHDEFPISEGLEIKEFTPDVLDLEVEEALHGGRLEVLFTGLEDKL
jgi:hypothetical protein